MSGIDPALASALASRIDMLLSAVSGPTDAKAAQAADAPAATQWANAQPTPTSDGTPPPPASAQAVLSQTARTLDVIARGVDGEPAPPVVGRQALWSNAPGVNGAAAVDARAIAGLASSLAMALEQALDTSGLFYESHLVQWMAGQRSSALLSQEPQSQLPSADDDSGFEYDAEGALRELADAPEPFVGRRDLTASSGTGSETIDVEIAEVDDGSSGTSDTHDAQTGPQAGAGAASGQAALAQSTLARLTQSGMLDGLILDADPADAAEADSGEPAGLNTAGTALVPAGRNGDLAGGNATGYASTASSLNSHPAANAASFTPTPGSTLFANAGNAAYAAQAAAQARDGSDAQAGSADRTAMAQSNPTLQASATPTSLPIHPDALSIVRQQLELLQSTEPRFRWSGQAWPDSRMYWELDWDPNDHSAADQRVWRTRIAIELPTLGLVDAELTLTGHRLGARITADGTSLGTLKDGTSDFMLALAGAGLNLEQLAIRNADGSLPARANPAGPIQGKAS